MDVWIQNSLALDDEFNYTETPNDTRILPPDTIPQLLPQSTIPPLYKDQDSVSTFCSRASLTSRHTEGNATEETNDLDTLAGSDTTESTTNTSLRKRRPPSPIPPQTAEISVDSTATTQQVSGLSEDNTRIGHLEQNMHEIKEDFKSALQQLYSRQQTMDKQFSDLYKLLKHNLVIHQTDTSTSFPQEQPQVEITGGIQSNAPASQDNPPASLDTVGDCEHTCSGALVGTLQGT